MCTNITLFDEYVAKILGTLYEHFPVKTGVSVQDLTGHRDIDAYGIIRRPDGQPSRQAEVAYATLEWLVETGYIRADLSSPGYSGTQCVLTALGLQALKATPRSLQPPGDSLGQQLVTALRQGAMDAAKEAAKAVIAIGAGTVLGA